ncbi:MAG TPA: phage major capsid protein, partial [Nitriliruptorales bacterium]|nr:phage major capsid protein [Nitriliruptorales bacterium]
IQAGVRTFEMRSQEVDIAKVLTDPDPNWRLENATITESEPTFGAMTLTAKSLATIVRASREVMEDAQGMDELVRDLLAKAYALEIDRVVLRGSGTGGEPTGIRNASGVTVTSLGTNGATPTYANLISAIGRVEDEDEDAGAIVWHPRTGRTFGGLTDTTDQPLVAPGIVANVPKFQSTQIPVNLTVGTSTDASEVYVGDFSQAVLGVRTDLVITPLRERYADVGQVGLVAWFRGDVGIRRAEAFEVLTGVRP